MYLRGSGKEAALRGPPEAPSAGPLLTSLAGPMDNLWSKASYHVPIAVPVGRAGTEGEGCNSQHFIEYFSQVRSGAGRSHNNLSEGLPGRSFRSATYVRYNFRAP